MEAGSEEGWSCVLSQSAKKRSQRKAKSKRFRNEKVSVASPSYLGNVQLEEDIVQQCATTVPVVAISPQKVATSASPDNRISAALFLTPKKASFMFEEPLFDFRNSRTLTSDSTTTAASHSEETETSLQSDESVRIKANEFHRQQSSENSSLKQSRIEDRLQMMAQVLPQTTNFPCYLDLGCGNCEITTEIAKAYRCTRVLACDVYPEEEFISPVQQKANQCLNITYISNGSDSRLNTIKATSVDLVTCFMVLHHIETLDDTLRELARVINEGGYLYIREHDVPKGSWETERYLREKHMRYDDCGSFMRFFGREELKLMLRQFAFSHIGDSLYEDSRPNRQKVYHSLFRKITPMITDQYILDVLAPLRKIKGFNDFNQAFASDKKHRKHPHQNKRNINCLGGGGTNIIPRRNHSDKREYITSVEQTEFTQILPQQMPQMVWRNRDSNLNSTTITEQRKTKKFEQTTQQSRLKKYESSPLNSYRECLADGQRSTYIGTKINLQDDYQRYRSKETDLVRRVGTNITIVNPLQIVRTEIIPPINDKISISSQNEVTQLKQSIMSSSIIQISSNITKQLTHSKHERLIDSIS